MTFPILCPHCQLCKFDCVKFHLIFCSAVSWQLWHGCIKNSWQATALSSFISTTAITKEKKHLPDILLLLPSEMIVFIVGCV